MRRIMQGIGGLECAALGLSLLWLCASTAAAQDDAEIWQVGDSAVQVIAAQSPDFAAFAGGPEDAGVQSRAPCGAI